MDIFYNYIIQAILGGASGYITNDYAINMLFKEYTPFKIGGVIKKTRNEFIDNLSSLVENDIINKDKLNEILVNDEFKIKFESLSEDFFSNCLYDTAGTDTFSNIENIDLSIKSTREFIKNISDKHMSEVTNLLFKNIVTEDFLNDVQLNKISNSLYESIDNLINNTDIIKELLLSTYSQYGNKKIVDFLDDEGDKITSTTENFINKFNNVIKDNFNYKINDFIKEISTTIEFDKSFVSAKKALYDKPFKEILAIDDDFESKIIKLFINYINSDKGQSAMNELCTSLFLHINRCDKTLFNIIDSSFEINLKLYLLDNLPNVTENIVKWIKINSNNIDKIIENSIDEVINESDGLKGKLLSTIKNSYLNDLSGKYNIVQKIIDYIQKETESEKLSSNISFKIIEYLNNISIGEMLVVAENNNILTPSIATNYLTQYLNSSFESIFNNFFNYFMSLKLKDFSTDKIESNNFIRGKIIDIIKTKILSSEVVNTSLSKKACSHINKFLHRNLNEILVEENFKNNIQTVNDFIVKCVNKNSDNIKQLLRKEIKENLSPKNIKSLDDGYKNISSMISKEINKKYNHITANIKDKDLSLVIDKLNSVNNLYKNSSDVLRTLMINNIDTILEGSVKGIVTENLNKLDDDELSNLANDFIGRELRPIMYFGGILGTGAGIILAATQNAPLNPETINFANMATYSLVGFSTNLIAINMIFKPYKEIKFLSKIPFLRNFSLGYIVKNKKVFAENMAYFIDKNLLSKESINELFDKYENDLKFNLNNGIKANDYLVLHKLLANNDENIIAGSYNFTKNLIDKNIKNLSNFTINKFNDFELSTLLSPANINYLADMGEKGLNNSKEKLEIFISTKLSSSEPLDSQIPNYFINLTHNKMIDFFEKYYDITSENLSEFNNVKNFMLKYDDRYKNLIDKPITEILKSTEIINLTSFISKIITRMILSESSKKKTTNTVMKLFNKALDGDKTFEELFNGKLKEYINDNIPSLFDKLSILIKNSIINSSSVVSTTVQNEVKSNLGFLQKGMYSIMGGDEIVNELIDKIMVDKATDFIDDKKYELLSIFNSVIVEKFYKAKVDNFQNSINKIQIDDMVNTYFSNDEIADIIEKKVSLAVVTLEKKIEKVNLNDILKFLSLQDINSIFSSYEMELNELFSNLSNRMIENKNEIINTIEPLLNEIIDEFIKTTSLKELCNHISSDDVNLILSNLIDSLNYNDFFKKKIVEFIHSYKDFIIGKDNLSNFVNADEFVKSTKTYITSLLNDNETELIVKNIYSSILREATELNFNFIDEHTKSYVVNIFVESCIKSVRRNLDTILKAIEFDRIARDEINAMEPKKVHEMFNAFGGKYFKRLMIYGLGGFIFGINTYVGLALAGLNTIGNKLYK